MEDEHLVEKFFLRHLFALLLVAEAQLPLYSNLYVKIPRF